MWAYIASCDTRCTPGLCAVMICVPLRLGSTLGLLCAIVPITLLALRIGVEERVLRGAIRGFQAYAHCVRRRLVPGIW